MDFISFFNNQSSGLVDFALSMLIQSAVLIVILFTLDLLLRRRVRAVFRYCLWMLLLVKLVLPVGLALPYTPGYWINSMLPQADAFYEKGKTIDTAPQHDIDRNTVKIDASAKNIPAGALPNSINIPGAPYNPAEITAVNSESVKAATNESPSTVSEVQVTAETIDTASGSTLSNVPFSRQSFAVMAWFAAVVIMLILLIQRVFFVRGLIRQSQLADKDLLSQLNRCASKMNVHRQIDLRVSPNTASPSVCGLLKPVILMPDGLTTRLSANQVDAIFMHELAHIKRGDLWVNLFQALLQIVYFYNPLLWFANAQIRRTREQAVDEMVLVAMEDRAEDYPETLLNVSKLVWSKPMLSLRLIGVVESKSALSARIKHILSRPFPKSAKLGLTGLAAIIIAAVILLPMAKSDPGKIGLFDRETLVKFTTYDKPNGTYKTTGKIKKYSKYYDLTFRKDEKLLVFAELYETGKPMRRLGHKILKGTVEPQRLAASLIETSGKESLDGELKNTNYQMQVQLGDEKFEVSSDITAPVTASGGSWNWYQGDGIEKCKINGKIPVCKIYTLLRYFRDTKISKETCDIWMPDLHIGEIGKHKQILVLRMVPLSQIDYRLEDGPNSGFQLPDGSIQDEGVEIVKKSRERYIEYIRNMAVPVPRPGEETEKVAPSQKPEFRPYYLADNPEFWSRNLGKSVTIKGVTVNTKIGAGLKSEHGTVWIDGLTLWPKDALLKIVRVTGIVLKRHDGPQLSREQHYSMQTNPVQGTAPLDGVGFHEGSEELHDARRRYLLKSIDYTVVEDNTAETPLLTEKQKKIVAPVLNDLADEFNKFASKYPELKEYRPSKALGMSMLYAAGNQTRWIEFSYRHNFTEPRAKRKIQPSDFGEHGFYIIFKCLPISSVAAISTSAETINLELKNLGIWIYADVKTGPDPSPGLVGKVRELLQKYSKTFKEIDNKTAEQDHKKYTATLLNDVNVELLGICDSPSGGKQWWSPQGKIIDRPYKKLSVSYKEPNYKLYELVCRITGTDNSPEIDLNQHVKGHFGMSLLGKKAEGVKLQNANDCYFVVISCEDETKQADIKISIGSESIVFENVSLRRGSDTKVNPDVHTKEGLEQFVDRYYTENETDIVERQKLYAMEPHIWAGHVFWDYSFIATLSNGQKEVISKQFKFDEKTGSLVSVEDRTSKMDPDLAIAMAYDLGRNHGNRELADRSLALTYYEKFLQKPHIQSWQKAAVYDHLGAMYAISMNQEKGEIRDEEQARKYYRKVLELEPQRIGWATIRARSMLSTLENDGGMERIKARMAFYTWLRKIDRKKLENNWLPSNLNSPVPIEGEPTDDQIQSKMNLIMKLRKTSVTNAAYGALKIPQEGFRYILKQIPEGEPEREIVQKIIEDHPRVKKTFKNTSLRPYPQKDSQSAKTLAAATESFKKQSKKVDQEQELDIDIDKISTIINRAGFDVGVAQHSSTDKVSTFTIEGNAVSNMKNKNATAAWMQAARNAKGIGDYYSQSISFNTAIAGSDYMSLEEFENLAAKIETKLQLLEKNDRILNNRQKGGYADTYSAIAYRYLQRAKKLERASKTITDNTEKKVHLFEKAAKLYERAIEIGIQRERPKLDCIHSLAEAYEGAGKIDQAVEQFRKLISADQTMFSKLRLEKNIIDAKWELSDPEYTSNVELILDKYKNDGNYASIAQQLALIYIESGQNAKAVPVLQLLSQTDADNPLHKRMLERLKSESKARENTKISNILTGEVVEINGPPVFGAQVSYATATKTVYVGNGGGLSEGFIGAPGKKCIIVETDGEADLQDQFEGYQFGPEKELVVQDAATNEKFMVDLETGKILTPDKDLKAAYYPDKYDRWPLRICSHEESDKFVKWIDKNSADIVSESGRGLQLIGGLSSCYDSKPPSVPSWDEVTVEEVVSRSIALRKRMNKKKDISAIPSTMFDLSEFQPAYHFITTRDGTPGIVQVLGVSNNPKGIKFRYKLVIKQKVLERRDVMALSAEYLLVFNGCGQIKKLLELDYPDYALKLAISVEDSFAKIAEKTDKTQYQQMVDEDLRELKNFIRLLEGHDSQNVKKSFSDLFNSVTNSLEKLYSDTGRSSSSLNKIKSSYPLYRGDIAVLDDGIVLEFVSVREHGGKQFWAVNGDLLDDKPYKSVPFEMTAKKGMKYYELCARASGKKDVSITWGGHAGSKNLYTTKPVGKDGKRIPGLDVCTTAEVDGISGATVRVGVSSKPWKKLASHPAGKGEQTYSTRIGGAEFGKPYEKDDKTFLPFRFDNARRMRLIPWRVTALLDDETELAGKAGKNDVKQYRKVEYVFDAPLSKIDNFQFQAREYQYVGFDSVALSAGRDRMPLVRIYPFEHILSSGGSVKLETEQDSIKTILGARFSGPVTNLESSHFSSGTGDFFFKARFDMEKKDFAIMIDEAANISFSFEDLKTDKQLVEKVCEVGPVNDKRKFWQEQKKMNIICAQQKKGTDSSGSSIYIGAAKLENNKFRVFFMYSGWRNSLQIP